MKKTVLSLLIGAILSLTAGEVLIDSNSSEIWAKKDQGETNNIVRAGYAAVQSEKFIPVKPGAKYTISGEFKLPEGLKKPVTMYFGFMPFTAEGKPISYSAVFTQSPVLGTLAEEIKPGDKKALVKDTKNWKIQPFTLLAFNAKTDKSDLPNFDLSLYIEPKETVVKEDGTLELTFKGAFKKGYPAGTPVRLHRAGYTYVYTGNTKKAGEWVKFTKTFTSFYQGCTQFKLAINVTGPKCDIEYKNISVTAE